MKKSNAMLSGVLSLVCIAAVSKAPLFSEGHGFCLLPVASAAPPSAGGTTLRREIEGSVGQMRRAMFVILAAKERGLAEKAALIYREVYYQDRNNNSLKALYSFSHFVAMSSFPYDDDSPARMKIRTGLYTQNAEVDHYWRQISQHFTSSAEVLVMNAMRSCQLGDYTEAISFARQARKVDPNWGYTYYWEGRASIAARNFGRDRERQKRLVLDGIESLRTAERLDPSLSKGNIQYSYVHAFSFLGDYESAIRHMDHRLAIVSATTRNQKEITGLRSWRASLLKRAAQQKAGG